jgi:hypothetical protein
MQIVELGDCSMVIMKDSEDPPWVSVGNIYMEAVNKKKSILIDKGNQISINYLESSDFVYTAGRLILFFKENIPPRFHVHDKVYLTALYYKVI